VSVLLAMQYWFFPSQTEGNDCGRLWSHVLNSRPFVIAFTCAASWEKLRIPTYRLPQIEVRNEKRMGLSVSKELHD